MENGRISIWKRLGMDLPCAQQRKRLRVSEVNPHLICVLCGGYYIDATTITECLHTFCKTCIVGYLEASKHCPVCDNLVHKTKPHLRLRPDHILQDLVYKLVPGLFQDEMNKRREFYKDEIQSGKLGDTGLPEERERMIYSQDEQISLVLELSSNGRPPTAPVAKPSKHHRLEAADRRYLQCPANITVGHLKKFLKMKFNLCDRFQIDFFHTDEILHDHYTLVDIAYIYSWRRKGPLSLYYTVFTNPAKRFKADHEDEDEDVVVEAEMSMKDVDISKVSERTETSGYLTDDEKDMDVNLSDRSLESNVLQETESGSNDSFELDTSDLDTVKPTTEDRALDNTSEDVFEKIKESPSSGGIAQPETVVLKQTDGASSVASPSIIERESTKLCEPKVDFNSENGQDVKSVVKDTIVIEKPKDTNDEDQNKGNSYVRQTNQKIAAVKDNLVIVKDKADLQITVESDKANIKTSQESHPKVTTFEKTHTSEASTSTGCITDLDMPTVTPRREAKVKDDDVSEPVVSSTQNTQACQTEPPDSHNEKYDLPRPSDYEKPTCAKTSRNSKVDVSCETDNFVALRQNSVDSVSVSTETDTDRATSTDNSRKKSVDCATDVFDFPQSVCDSNKRTVECSTDPREFPASTFGESKRKALTVDCSTDVNIESSIGNKRKALSVDCSTEMDGSDLVQIKRKSLDSLDQRSSDNVKSESKGTKRSNSYSHSPKPSYMAQPLSPTRIALKFSATRSPTDKPLSESVKPSQASKAQSQVTGFQSQYQSFVMELPDKTYDFESESEKRIQPTHPVKSSDNYKQTYMNAISNPTKKSQSKTGRPRGRPPKVKVPQQVNTHKEKKHKSRSHSPKHKKHNDKHSLEKQTTSADAQSVTLSQTTPTSTPSNAYTWINKMNTSTKQQTERKQHKSKSVERSNSTPGCEIKRTDEAPGGELKIPKQFLYFSNGQYTLATESSLATLKQSSPISPTTTVWENQTSSYGDKHSKSEKIKDKDKERKGEKSEKAPEKSNTDKHSTKRERENVSCAKSGDKVVNAPKPTSVGAISNLVEKKESTMDTKVTNVDVKVSNANRNAISKNGPEVKQPPPPPPPHSSVSSSSSETTMSTNKKQASSESNKETISSTSEKFPEYRHQSPFFASYTRLGVQRPSTHLNIPNFTSHFNSAHSLYNHTRYTSERLGIPIYRSMAHGEPKSVNVSSVPISNAQDKQRLESMTSHCGFIAPYPSPYLSLSHLHSHIASSLQPSMLPRGFSPDTVKSQISAPVSSSNATPQNKSAIKGVTARKGKEKSIDNIISAITEMRTKKETSANEQLNGIDLSTKSSRQNSKTMATNNNDKLDRYAFPDDDENNRTSPKKGPE